ncbi:macrolide ABC transporter ATP-binding protein [Suicoccus acidiformans]|uniref:Macrolide ABC transporter ATP-binding protein n=1 Tax=Suicoccus acidiformans TaxID=2036206 RepID=A0A347WMX8_9LACT|nr:ABC transporter ATP-binding protein [Suicoccus acidiformans]AXY26435.1 macrolide ABC transporter ATP-binding protein [Suicoccus acidiformans]
MSNVLIEFDNVSKVYGKGETPVRANDSISFQIMEGEFVVILGQSGAGKSTTLNLLAGMDYPSTGQIWVEGENIAEYSLKQQTLYRRSKIGFVFQAYNLIPHLTAKENVNMMIEIANSQSLAEDALQAVGLTNRMEHFPRQLSGGEQQRVSIARALASNPKILLCDEPTGALDSATGDKIIQTLKDYNRNYGTTCLVITHNREIAEIADRVIELKDGKVASNYIND